MHSRRKLQQRLESNDYKHNLDDISNRNRLLSNLYIMVTLGKWPGDHYIRVDRSIQVSFKLPWKSMNSIFMSK